MWCNWLIFYLLLNVDDSIYFSIKLYHGGDLNETSEEYVGGKISYFDMCSVVDMTMIELGAMLGEVGVKLEETEVFNLILGTGLPHGLLLLESQNDVDDLLNLVVYSHHHVLYTKKKKVFLSAKINDFEFSQLSEDQKGGKDRDDQRRGGS